MWAWAYNKLREYNFVLKNKHVNLDNKEGWQEKQDKRNLQCKQNECDLFVQALSFGLTEL